MQVKALRALIKECVIEVLTENLTEGFDPTSAGPNPAATEETQGDPYKQWNAEMRKMEESTFDSSTISDSDLEYYIKNSGLSEREETIFKLKMQGYTDSELSKRYNVTPGQIKNINDSAVFKLKRGVKKDDTLTPLGIDPSTRSLNPYGRHLRKENEHGRYAQDAGAGQFDPRTFDPNTKI